MFTTLSSYTVQRKVSKGRTPSCLLALILFLCLITVMSCSLPRDAFANAKTQQWLSYYNGSSKDSFEQIYAFIKANPDFPAQRRLRFEAEKRIKTTSNPAQVTAFFQTYDPITSESVRMRVDQLLNQGQTAKARSILGEWWPNANITREEQRAFYKSYGSLIDKQTHQARLNQLLHNTQNDNARGMAAALGPAYQALAEARIALSAQSSDVNEKIAAVPSALQSDPGLLYERIRWRRKNDQDQGAKDLLANAPKSSDMHSPKDWWLERHIIARRLIEQRRYQEAYQLVSEHRQEEDLPFAQAEWLAGWLALRFTNAPDKAFKHFEALHNTVKSPISKARAAYWAGRAAQTLNYADVAREWYKDAAQHDMTFYGQMAAQIVGSGRASFTQNNFATSSQKSFSYAASSDTDSSQTGSVLVKNQDIVLAIQYLASNSYKSETALFVNALNDKAQNISDYKSIARFANTIGYPHLAISSAQKAHGDYGKLLQDYAYPQIIQDVKGVKDVEWALIHGLIRQESRFDPNAESRVGALGLMQVMPATARETARSLGISHQTQWLTTRPDHNIQIGVRYIRKMLDRYDNNYAMALAAYNAGPGRVDQWVQIYGDPRTGQVDIIDWIELIPIYETRNYVQRVLEAVQIYRLSLPQNGLGDSAPIHVSYHQ